MFGLPARDVLAGAALPPGRSRGAPAAHLVPVRHRRERRLILLDSVLGAARRALSTTAVSSVGFALLPVAVGVAMLRYRLYEIDRIVSRTVSYGLLSAGLIGLYLLVVALLRPLLEPLTGSSALAVAASTLAVAAVFNPARRRLQAAVDRRFDRARYDAARAVDAFAARLRDQVDLDEITGGLRDTVAATVAPARVAVWLRAPPDRGDPSREAPGPMSGGQLRGCSAPCRSACSSSATCSGGCSSDQLPAGDPGWLEGTIAALGFAGIPIVGALMASRLPDNPVRLGVVRGRPHVTGCPRSPDRSSRPSTARPGWRGPAGLGLPDHAGCSCSSSSCSRPAGCRAVGGGGSPGPP